MRKQILDVGNCSFDHGRLVAWLARHWACDVQAAPDARSADRAIDEASFDLVFVNRVFDGDASIGLDWIDRVRSRGRKSRFVLVTNYPEVQAEALARGVDATFGKRDIGSETALTQLRPLLDPAHDQATP